MERQSLIGKRFGFVVVKEMLYGYGKHGETYCRCQCDCGNECLKIAYDLKTKQKDTASCGCKSRELASISNRKDLTGQRFGRAVVLEMKYKKNEPTMAVCQCDCGNIFETKAVLLTNGNTTSCGCRKDEILHGTSSRKDFTGMVSDYGIELLRPAEKYRKQFQWWCKCGLCGKEFIATPAHVLNGHTTSCGCSKRSSRERLIANILNNLNVTYIEQHIFEGCRNVKPLRFDFYIPYLNTVIEYQGEQHYRSVDKFGGDEGYKTRQQNDEIKRVYCKENNIRLIKIPYSKSDVEIKEIITNIINA